MTATIWLWTLKASPASLPDGPAVGEGVATGDEEDDGVSVAAASGAEGCAVAP
jgi:hypothetical protein